MKVRLITRPPDLDALAAWLSIGDFATRGGLVQDRITPSDLQRSPWRLTWNGACAALEALEARGDLERVPGSGLVWKLRQTPDLALCACGQCYRDKAFARYWRLRQKPAQPQDEPLRLTAEEREALVVVIGFFLRLEGRPAVCREPVDLQLLLDLRERLERGRT